MPAMQIMMDSQGFMAPLRPRSSASVSGIERADGTLRSPPSDASDRIDDTESDLIMAGSPPVSRSRGETCFPHGWLPNRFLFYRSLQDLDFLSREI